MRKTLGILLVLVALAMAAVIPVSAHVHGITPLGQCTVDAPNSGALQVRTTPAGADNGGPISGLIPATVGEAPLTRGDGGFGAAEGNCP